MNRICNILIITIVFLTFTIGNVQALSVSDIVICLEGEPGSVISKTIKVKTSDSKKSEVIVGKENFSISKSGLIQRFNKAIRSCTTWIDCNDKIVFNGEEQKDISIKINVPKDAKGSYKALIVLSQIKKDNIAAYPVGVRILVPLFVTVKGTEKNKVKLSEFSVDKESGRLNFIAELKNIGNVFVRPQVKVSLYSKEGKNVESFVLGNEKILFPGLIRRLEKVLDTNVDGYAELTIDEYGIKKRIVI